MNSIWILSANSARATIFTAESAQKPLVELETFDHQFWFVNVRYRGLAKNTAQLHTLFALSNL
jgi:IS5 family transposase